MNTLLKRFVTVVQACLALVRKNFETLKANNKIELRTWERKLRAANGLPIEVRGVIRVPVKLGTKLYDFCVLERSEADCLLGLNFLEKHKCDPLLSQMELKFVSGNSVPLYHKLASIRSPLKRKAKIILPLVPRLDYLNVPPKIKHDVEVQVDLIKKDAMEEWCNLLRDFSSVEHLERAFNDARAECSRLHEGFLEAYSQLKAPQSEHQILL